MARSRRISPRNTAGIAIGNAASASRQHALTLSRQLAFQSLSIDPANPVTARRLAVAAWGVFPTGQAASAITTLLAEQQQGMLPADTSNVFAVAFSPHGKLLASATFEGHRGVDGGITIRASLRGTLRRCRAADEARLEQVRPRRTATQDLRLRPRHLLARRALPPARQ